MPEGIPMMVNDKIIPVEEAKVGDSVLGMSNQEQKISEVMSYDYSGNLFSIKAIGIPEFSVTPEHLMLIAERWRDSNKELHYSNNTQWKKSSELVFSFNKSDCLVFPKYKIYEPISEINLSKHYELKTHKSHSLDKLSLSKETMIIFGLYLAEGWVTETPNDTKIQWCFSLDEKETLVKDVLLSLKKIGLWGRVKEGDHSIIVTCSSKQLGLFLIKEFGRGAYYKRIPNFVMNTNDENVKIFLKYLILGDGNLHYYTNQKLTSYTTISPTLAYQFQSLLSKLDIFSHIYRRKAKETVYKGRKIIGKYDPFINVISNKGSEKIWELKNKKYKNKHYNTIWETPDSFYLPIKNLIKKPFNGKVYNYKTEDSTFQINNIITHNSNYGFNMMAICEFLHCSFSELDKRCPSIADKMLILQYILRKNEKEEYAARLASQGVR